MLRDGYVLFDETIETIQPNEQEIGEKILSSIGRTIAAVANARERNNLKPFAARGAHAKGHGILKGELRVNENLPEHLRQGIFSAPDTYPVIVRFSTAFGNFRSDNVKVARGMAIKVVGVNGEKALADDTSANQDFLLVNQPVYFADIAAYKRITGAIELLADKPDAFFKVLEMGAAGTEKLLRRVGIKPPVEISSAVDEGYNILGETFYSMAAIRFGDYIAKMSAAPSPGSLNKQLERVPAGQGENVLQNIVSEFFKNKTAEFDLRAQLCRDLEQMPVENASVRWPEELAKHEPVARVILPPQQPLSEARREYNEVISFTPWRCLATHRPLGSIMRIRKKAYDMSSAFRHEQNSAPTVEPRDIADAPD